MMSQRFEAMDKRFEEITRRLDRFMLWSMGLYVGGIGAVITLVWKLIPIK